ncbi:unnamed protein product, partial [Porites evermanni]
QLFGLLRYVDDTFTAVHKDGIDDFHEHLNRQNADIQFTKEIEENGKITFLDYLSSYNPTSHKTTTIRTLTRRAQLVCDSPDSLQDETDYLNNVFSKNNYTMDFVRGNTHSNPDSNTQTNSGPVTTATIPYMRGTSETIARILQPYNIRVAHKPITTLRRLLTNVKDKDKSEDRQGATKHRIDWDSATCITYSTDYYQRLTLEIWFTNLEQTPLNRSQQLPAPYKRLLDEIKQN